MTTTRKRDEGDREPIGPYERVVSQFRQRAFLKGDLRAVDEYLTSDFVDHFAPPWDPPGIEGVRLRFAQAAQAFETTDVEIVHSMKKGHVLMQAIRIHMKHIGDFMGLPATGRAIVIGGFDAFEFRVDKLAGHWGVYDVSRIPDLLGLTPGLPSPEATPSWAAMWGTEER
jgi:predicted ester cyclase